LHGHLTQSETVTRPLSLDAPGLRPQTESAS